MHDMQNGMSCLITSAYSGQLEVVKYLCGLGNRHLMSLKDKDGVSPVEHAQNQGHTEVVTYLESVKLQS
jgi:ankyrin repeat protein